jgi:hypothetical protein
MSGHSLKCYALRSSYLQDLLAKTGGVHSATDPYRIILEIILIIIKLFP